MSYKSKRFLSDTHAECNKCHEIKLLEDFIPNNNYKNGRCARCKKCYNEDRIAYFRKKGVPEKKTIFNDGVNKKCGSCTKILPISEFHKNKNAKDGLVYNCKKCVKEKRDSYRINHGLPVKDKLYYDGINKECSKCHKILNIDNFYNSNYISNGKRSLCKNCSDREVNEYKHQDPLQQEKRSKIYQKNKHISRMQSRRAVLLREIREIDNNDGTINADILKIIYSCEYCYYCDKLTSEDKRTIDHVQPLSRNGPHSIYNLVMCCKTCNCRKHNKTQSEYFVWCQSYNITCFPYWNNN